MKTIISKEDLERVYVKEKKSLKEVAQYFNVKPYVVSNHITIYNIHKESQEDILQKTLKRYSREEIKKLYQELSYTELAQYLEITQDVLARVLKEYKLGKKSKVKNVLDLYSKEDIENMYLNQNMSLEELSKALNLTRESTRTVLSHYSLEKPKGRVFENIKKTWLEKYGTTNINLVPEIVEKREQTCLKKYGAKCYLISKQCYSEFRNNSKPNQKFAKLLKSRNIEFEKEFPLGNNSFDFRIGNNLLEINPYATHNSTWGIRGDKKGKDSKYHQSKTLIAQKAGYRCIHVWDWDDQEKLVEMLLPKLPVYARKCELKIISQYDANRFLKTYHLQGRATLQTVCYGLFFNSDLVEVMTFGKPRFNKHFQWELIRLCTKSDLYVIGGAERIFKHFIQEHNPENIVSYCDNAKFSGEVYRKLGFSLKSLGIPSRHWWNPETKTHVTDNGLRMKGFDKLFGNQYGTYGKGTSNDELMRQHGFVEIYDAGQSVYIWQKVL